MPRLLKLFLLTVVIIAGGSLSPFSCLAGEQQPIRQRLEIHLDPDQHALQGDTIINLTAQAADNLVLHLAPQARINLLQLNGTPVAYAFAGGIITVAIPAPQQGQPLQIAIAYSVRFADQPPTNFATSEDPSFGVSASIGPQGVFLGGGAGWYPELAGQSVLYDIEVTAPAGMVAVTSGGLENHRSEPDADIVRWTNHHPLDSLSLSAGNYQIREDHAGEVPIYTFFYPESADLADTYLQAVKGYLNLYQKLFGAYPFEKFAVVENFFPTGYGFPSWTLLGKSILRLPFIISTSLGHEIAHSWWGTGIDVKPGTGNWAEGLTTYVADYLYQENKSAADGRAYRLKILRDYASLVNPGDDFPLRDFTFRINKPAQAIGYGKGAMVFHMLHCQLGDEAFWKGLRLVIHNHLYGEASWDDFRTAFEKTSGRNLQTFFDQWLDRAGAPVLSLSNVEKEQTADGWRVKGELHQSTPYYQLPVPLVLKTDSGQEVATTVQLNGAAAPFSLNSTDPPKRLEVDPDVTLFRHLAPEEVPVTVNTVRGATNLTVIEAADQNPAVLQQGQLLVQALQKGDSPVWQESSGKPAPTGGNRLILGLPHNSELQPPLPKGFTLSPHQVNVAGTEVEQGAAVFLVLPDKTNPQGFTAWFYAQSPDAAASAARKIPHYGKYSYLLFKDGRNIVKDTWPVTASPTIVSFNNDKE